MKEPSKIAYTVAAGSLVCAGLMTYDSCSIKDKNKALGSENQTLKTQAAGLEDCLNRGKEQDAQLKKKTSDLEGYDALYKTCESLLNRCDGQRETSNDRLTECQDDLKECQEGLEKCQDDLKKCQKGRCPKVPYIRKR